MLVTITDGVRRFTVEGEVTARPRTLTVPGNPSLAGPLKMVLTCDTKLIADFIMSTRDSTDPDVSSPRTIDIFTPEAAFKRFRWETVDCFDNQRLEVTGVYLG